MSVFASILLERESVADNASITFSKPGCKETSFIEMALLGKTGTIYQEIPLLCDTSNGKCQVNKMHVAIEET